MSSISTMPLWPLAVYAGLVTVVVFVMVGLSYLLGQRGSARSAEAPYESGIVSEGSAKLRFTARFYLAAMLFLMFDLESAFIFAWSVAVRPLGWRGYASIATFIVLLALALVYLWRSGALVFGPKTGHRIIARPPSGGGERSHESS